MSITLVLPGYSKVPVGGFKMVFEYANRFVARGHAVSIVFDCSSSILIYLKYRFSFLLKCTVAIKLKL